jgi:uncharacterized repeat protein (TIGR01451 family)
MERISQTRCKLCSSHRLLKILGALALFLVTLCSPALTRKTSAQTSEALPASASSVAWSPDGTQLAVAGSFGIAIYASDFHLVGMLSTALCNKIAWSPDGKYIAAHIGTSNSIAVFDIQSRQVLSQYALSEQDRIASLSWRPTNRYLAFSVPTGNTPAVYIWDPSSNQVVFSLVVPFLVRDAAWSPDGSHVAAVGGQLHSPGLIIWNANSGASEFSLPQSSQTEDLGPIFSLAWNTNSREIALGVGGGLHSSVPIFDTQTQQILDGFDGPVDEVPALAWSHSGQKVAASEGATGEGFYVWDASSKKQLLYLRTYTPEQFPDTVTTIAWNPNDSQIATIHYNDPTLRIYDAASGTQVAAPQLPLNYGYTLTPTATSTNTATPIVTATSTPTPTFTLTPTPGPSDLRAKVAACVTDQGIANSLNAKINANQWQAFINEVQAQSGKKIPQPCADDLVATATYILNHPTPTTTRTPTPVPQADLSLTLIVTNQTPMEGEVINYVLTYGNSGPNTASGVTITVPLPQGVTLQSANGGGSYNAATGVWTIGTVIKGQNATISLQVKVKAGTRGQTIVASATISAATSDPNAANNNASASLTVR